jgi:hypothetical protein
MWTLRCFTPSARIQSRRRYFVGSKAVIGESVIVFGYPLPGLLSDSGITTDGRVNALSGVKNNADVIQISAPIHREIQAARSLTNTVVLLEWWSQVWTLPKSPV